MTETNLDKAESLKGEANEFFKSIAPLNRC